MRRRFLFCCLFGLFSLFLSFESDAAESPNVAVSIRPIHSLVSGIMAGVGEPALIIKGNRSPHAYNLKPSDAQTLSRANLIVWVGPGLELFLEKPISALSDKSRVITLVNDPAADPHFWLSPALSTSIIHLIVRTLAEADPQNETLYKSNGDALRKRLITLQAKGSRVLEPFSKIPFMVFHDAWNHFARAFGLSVAGSIAVNPERPPGAKKITAIRRQIEEFGLRCLFTEPQFQSPLLPTILEGNDDVNVFEIDPLGASLAPGQELYFQMMENIIKEVQDCLD